MRRISASDTSVPSRALIFSGSSFTVTGAASLAITSSTPSTTSPASSSSTSSQARWTAFMVFMGSRPFSYRDEASVRIPRAVAVRRTEAPLKLADSNRTMAVSPTISELAPPMTPATHTGRCSSQMHSMDVVRAWSLPSRVWMDSPSRAVRTTMCPPSTQEKSKACIGWPYSSMT